MKFLGFKNFEKVVLTFCTKKLKEKNQNNILVVFGFEFPFSKVFSF